MKINKNLFIISFLILTVLFLFKSIFLSGLLPIPSDTIIGLYHPFRDLYAKDYPNGIPFKNFLITDPVRQQYPWRNLAITKEKKLELPLWNPYQFSGTPLLGNFQTSAFYPLNILFFILPFSTAWTVLIVLQPILAALFLYFYLRYWKCNTLVSFFGASIFAFCGFSIAWMEWNTVLQVGLWLPLVLLSIDKIVLSIKVKKIIVWSFIYIFALVFSFFAGHLQPFFYLYVISNIYFFARWVNSERKKGFILLYVLLNTLFLICTAIQWFPTLQFILESARNIDQADWQKAGWFIPWEHVVQFLAPDFFGNPTTLNYWGIWNYAEFIGYIGFFPLCLALYALFFRRDKKTFFFGTVFFLSLIFSLPTTFAKLPFLLQIPFLSSAQPTRLLYSIDFSLIILAVLGLDYFIKVKRNIVPFILIFSLYILLWIFVLTTNMQLIVNITIAKRNLLLPTVLASVVVLLVFLLTFIKKGKRQTAILVVLMFITLFDLFRFAEKFLPFTNKTYLFPKTETIMFLQNHVQNYRIMATDSRLLPPNFSTVYKLQNIDGYDPLYLRRYAELIVASEREKPNIQPPFGFNRIITPQKYDAKIINLLGVKYILTLSDITSPTLTKVFQEGQTKVYENLDVFPRAFFVETVKKIMGNNKQEVIETMYKEDFDLQKKAIAEGFLESEIKIMKLVDSPLVVGEVEIFYYSENKIVIQTKNHGSGFLVLTDNYYPTWKARIDGEETKIYRTDYNFRGIFVPKGNHEIEFFITLL